MKVSSQENREVLIGFFVSLADNRFLLGPQAKLLLMVGFCGAFTTFSTFILETDYLLKDGETLRALLNILLSVAIGFLVFRAGVLVGKIL